MEQLPNLDLRRPTPSARLLWLRFILAGFWIARWGSKSGTACMPATEAFFKQQAPAVRLLVVIRFEVVIAAGPHLGIGVPLLVCGPV